MKGWPIVFVLATLSALVVAVSSGAAVSPTGNVPYLAWNGESVQLGSCLGFDREFSSDELDLVRAVVAELPLPGNFLVEDWSGATDVSALPRWTNGNISGNRTEVPVTVTTLGLCWYANVTSLKPGLAVVKVAVSLQALSDVAALLADNGVDIGDVAAGHVTLLKQQHLVVFMTLAPPILTNLGSSTPLSGGPGADLSAVLKGIFPLGNTFSGLVPGDLVTLPDQWAALALRLATDPSDPDGSPPGSAAMFWDIHDDTLPTSGHVPGDCGAGFAFIDAVDNCLGGTPAGPFSFTFGGAGLVSSATTVGPYDPLLPGDTFLGDGKLDARDAPMPAARIDFTLHGASSGSLTAVSKTTAYSRDGTGAATPGNLFAPFYSAYIPAAGPFGRSGGSGVAGGFGNNFPGFFGNGLYDFWNVYPLLEDAGSVACRDSLGSPYPLDGVLQAVLYSDEHGEARVHYSPDRILPTPDLQDRCDLGPADGTAQNVGTATITAKSVYPDELPIWDQANKVSTPNAVAVQERAGASLDCVPNGVGESFCFAVVLDLAGAPVPGAEIRFTRLPLGTIEAASVAAGGFDATGQTAVSSTADEVVLRTNAQGTAGAHIVASTADPIEVQAELVGTRWTPQSVGVTRTATVDPLVFDQVEATAPPGGTVSTGSTPSPTNPVETSVTTPSGGTVIVVASNQGGTGPVGYAFLDKQVTIIAPVESATSPLQLVFQLDASVLGSADPATLAIFRNGVLVPDCTGAPGAADPDPCVASRTALTGGGAEFTVLTSEASTWTFARPAPCVGPAPPGAIVRGSGNDTINGTPGDDVIVDSGGNNTINGNGGNDIICSGRGNDRIDGGAGNDAIVDTGGNNDIRGGDGVDSITMGAGNDTIDSGAGNDTVDAAGGNNAVKTGDGADSVTTGSGNDTVDSGAGNDTIDAGNGNNQVAGGDGDDGIAAGTGNDNVDGGPAFDTCRPGTGKNTVKNCEA